MNHRQHRSKMLLFLAVASATFLPFLVSIVLADEMSDGQRPNIVLIMADDLGYECLSCNGGTSYDTPNLDRLATTGIRFKHCYSQPLCTPSRVQLMTGIYNVRNYERFGLLPKNQTTFADLVQDSGYETCVVGKWQLQQNPFDVGFDEYCLWHFNDRRPRYSNPGLRINGKDVNYENGEYGPDIVCDFACDFIRRNKSQPFLVYYPMILTHCPFCPTPDSPDWDPTRKGSASYKGKPKYFADMVMYMDKTVGRIVETLEANELREKTIILFTGDNGTDKPVVSMMGKERIVGAKGSMTDAGTHVPLICNWPGQIKPNQVSESLVDFSDFLPTVCKLAGTKPPDDIDGQSFVPQLLGKLETPRQWIYVWFSRNGGKSGNQWARNQRYKLYGSGQFFDVVRDPLEKSPLKPNLGEPDEQRSARTMLQQALDRFKDARPDKVAEVGEKKKRSTEKNRAKDNNDSDTTGGKYRKNAEH